MPTKKNSEELSDKEIVKQIREVIADYNSDFMLKAHRNVDGLQKGQVDDLDAGLTVTIIEDILKGKAGTVTQDYRKTKVENRSRALKQSAPSPA